MSISLHAQLLCPPCVHVVCRPPTPHASHRLARGRVSRRAASSPPHSHDPGPRLVLAHPVLHSRYAAPLLFRPAHLRPSDGLCAVGVREWLWAKGAVMRCIREPPWRQHARLLVVVDRGEKIVHHVVFLRSSLLFWRALIHCALYMYPCTSCRFPSRFTSGNRFTTESGSRKNF